jgi:hypothetical protein
LLEKVQSRKRWVNIEVKEQIEHRNKVPILRQKIGKTKNRESKPTESRKRSRID